jgi:hypothetical protein
MSDKSVSTEQQLAASGPGPWTAFNPLLAGWGLSAGNFALARYRPDDNSVELLFYVTITAAATTATVADGYGWAVMPPADAAGNPLRPAQTLSVPVMTDRMQTTTPTSPRIHVSSGGSVTLFGLNTVATWMRCTCQRYTLDALGV